jgi:hypothetical protein
MTPTGSWPIVSPGLTGYSPLRMWTSVQRIERSHIGDRLFLKNDAAGFDENRCFHFRGHRWPPLTDGSCIADSPEAKDPH